MRSDLCARPARRAGPRRRRGRGVGSRHATIAATIAATPRAARSTRDGGREVDSGRAQVETLDEGASIFRAWQNRTGARIRLVLVAAPAVWGLRNPGASWTRFAAFVPLLEEWASRAARSAHGDIDGNADGHADDGQPVFSSIDVLDPAPATLARRDETDDGIHYGRTREEKGLGLVGANAALAAAVYRLVS